MVSFLGDGMPWPLILACVAVGFVMGLYGVKDEDQSKPE